jgi:hypothetical protein
VGGGRFDQFKLTGEEFIDANEDQVIVRIHQSAVGAQSGVPIEADFWHVHTMREGKGTRLDMVPTKNAGTRSRRAARQTVEQLATWVDGEA